MQQDHLFWMVCAWNPDFTGYVIDYGAWPEQGRNYFTRSDIRRKLSNEYAGDESAIMFAALTELGDKLAGSHYLTVDGRALSLDRWCIDGGFHQRVPATEAYVNQSPYRKVIAVTKGMGVTAKERPLSLSPRAIEQRIGPFAWYWREGKRDGGWLTFDTNFWKTRVHVGIGLPLNARGSIQLFQASELSHRMLADHLRAEKPTRVNAKGNTVYEWKQLPNRDNDGFDALVGCALGASICGIKKGAERVVSTKKRMSLKELANKAHDKSRRRSS